ncbi:zinc-binding dehydrogenase [Levilactobacillus fujinensis]|uniref:Zinc-binding dehydrogenase n=2 Tax=Levilactobacillus fujinensis TaxID=2486024 RepID=A0ABW1TIK6_9LACO|nr:zinc-binding dehydrogenase [Levilactobacillus fujinensis]
MQAWTITGAGPHSLNELQLQDVPAPLPQTGELQVRVHAVGLNPADYKVITGGSWQIPHVIGMDVAGEVTRVGANVTDFTVGERVFYHGDLRRSGSLAEFTVTCSWSVAKIPASVSYEQAAASLCGTLTAYQALYRKANLSLAKTILIHAGGGAVGLAALQFAHQLGLTTITTTSARKRALIDRVGADIIIDYHTENVTEKVRAATNGRGVDLSINTIGGEELAADVDRLAYNGQIIAVGDGYPQHFDFDDKALGLTRSGLGGVYRSADFTGIHDLATMATAVGDLLAAGKFDPVIDRILPFDQAQAGLMTLQRGENLGKIVVRI